MLPPDQPSARLNKRSINRRNQLHNRMHGTIMSATPPTRKGITVRFVVQILLTNMIERVTNIGA